MLDKYDIRTWSTILTHIWRDEQDKINNTKGRSDLRAMIGNTGGVDEKVVAKRIKAFIEAYNSKQ